MRYRLLRKDKRSYKIMQLQGRPHTHGGEPQRMGERLVLAYYNSRRSYGAGCILSAWLEHVVEQRNRRRLARSYARRAIDQIVRSKLEREDTPEDQVRGYVNRYFRHWIQLLQVVESYSNQTYLLGPEFCRQVASIVERRIR